MKILHTFTATGDEGMTMNSPQVIIDRNVVSILNPTTTTPSSIPTHTENLHRLHGTSLISNACAILQKNPSTFATACCIFHRFYHSKSLRKYDVWSTSMACLHLAGKVEDDFNSLRKLILCYIHLYRKRRNHGVESNLEAFPPISPMGRVYKEWKDKLIEMESVILRALGFVLYWIPDSHPHKYILYFIRVVVDSEKECVLAQTAWNYCNDSCFLDICVRYAPEVTACAAIYLASKKHNIPLPSCSSLNETPWYEILIGKNQQQSISNICNALLFLENENDDDGIVKKAFLEFIPSLLDGGSFNDPDSFIWLWMDEFELSLS